MPDDKRGDSVLIVDDAPENLRILVAVLKSAGFEPRPVTSGELAIETALFDPPDLVLLDVNMPGMTGWDVCRSFKNDERLRDIPIIFISGLQGTDDKVEAFNVGGVDYVSKPFHEQEVLARVRTHLNLRKLQRELASQNVQLEQRIADQVKVLTATQRSTIFALAKLAEIRDDDTGKHIVRVQTFSLMLAKQMREMGYYVEQLTNEFIDNIYQTAALHDIGKVGIPDVILLKPAKLTVEEFEVMKTHCAIGADTLIEVLKQHPGNQFIRMGVEVARSHHEKWNGSGYPDGFRGEITPLAARIVALADFYDALTSKRCYHAAVSHEDTRNLIIEGNGIHFDPSVECAFMAVDDQFRRVRYEMMDR
jgi:putative two-component system response regulator